MRCWPRAPTGLSRAIASRPTPNDPAIKLMEAGAHPDFVRLERLEKDDKKGEGGSLARNISVDQVRSLARLLNNAPSMGTRRVILIDSADDLETGAANALLKTWRSRPRVRSSCSSPTRQAAVADDPLALPHAAFPAAGRTGHGACDGGHIAGPVGGRTYCAGAQRADRRGRPWRSGRSICPVLSRRSP